MADDDLDAQFALFQQQIQSVTAKRRKLNSESTPPPVSDDAYAHRPHGKQPPGNHSNPKTESRLTHEKDRQPKATVVAQGIGPTTASQAATSTVSALPQAGRWQWDGSSWKWQVTIGSSQTNADASNPFPDGRKPIATSGSLLHVGNNRVQVDKQVPGSLPTPKSPSVTTHPVAEVPRESKKRRHPLKRTAAGNTWEDHVLAQFPENDHRIFVGDLAPDASEVELDRAFSRYPSYNMARVVRDKHTGLCRGYGFVSFSAGEDMVAALKEMNGKYVGSRPVKLRKSTWQKRNLTGGRRRELKEFKHLLNKR